MPACYRDNSNITLKLTDQLMKILERNLSRDDAPARVGRALLMERPHWRVTCVLRRQGPLGVVAKEATHEVTASREESARDAVRAFMRQTEPGFEIESVQAVRLPRR